MTCTQGRLDGLAATPGEPLIYHLTIGANVVPISDHIGNGVRLRSLDVVTCASCGNVTPRSYAGGYCYACFKTLARCDLCMMDPTRCHFAAGTCREPLWAQTFCTQHHSVYLANSSGVKVGITRAGREFRRWTDQGAAQALCLLRTATRPAAGKIEVQLAQFVSDRTRWRDLVSRRSSLVDLAQIAANLSTRIELPETATWTRPWGEQRFDYPVLRHAPPVRLKLNEARPVQGVLLGVKGQYLLFPQGAFNVSEHAGHHVALEFFPASVEDVPHNEQLELFER